MREKTYTTPLGYIHYWINLVDVKAVTLVFLPGLTAGHRLVVSMLMCVLVLSACGKDDTHKISITVPAGTTGEFIYQEDFIYSDEEISPTGNKITISASQELGDSEVVLKPIQVKEENAYEPTYITPGLSVEMDVEKGAWFKVGIAMENPTDEDVTVYVLVEGVEVRIEE